MSPTEMSLLSLQNQIVLILLFCLVTLGGDGESRISGEADQFLKNEGL